MRILVLVARDWRHPRAAGGDRHIGLLARELAAAGFDVTLWGATDPSLPRAETCDGVQVRRLAPPRLLAPVVWARLRFRSRPGPSLIIEEVMGGERTPFLARLWSPIPTVGFWYQDNRPLFADQYGPVARRLAGVVQALLLLVYRHGYLLTPSRGSEEWLIGQGVAPHRVAVFFVRADPAGLADASRPFSERRDRIVSVGNFRPLKRFEEAIAVLVEVLRHHPGAELVLIGRREDPNYLADLRRKVQLQGVQARVRFAVDIPEAEKYRLLSEAKVLTIHSHIEGFGLTLCEAGLCGVPAVVNPGVPDDAFREGVSGWRLPFGDVAGYARACTRLLREEETWNRLSRGAIETARPYTSSGLDSKVVQLLSLAVTSASHRDLRQPAE